MARGGCSNECTLSSFGLRHPEPGLFYSSEWQCNRWRNVCRVLYLVHRVVWATYLLAWILASGLLPGYWCTRPENKVKWLVYLTNWSFLLLTLSALIRAVVAIYGYARYVHNDIDAPKAAWWIQLNWFVYSLSSAPAITVSVLFWAVIFTGDVDSVDVHTHGVNSFYVIVDILITAMPLRILHFWIPWLLGIVYVVFTIIYDFSGGSNGLDEPYVYSVLDWSANATKAGIYTAIAMAGIFVLHCLLFAVSKLRSCACARCVEATEVSEMMLTAEMGYGANASREPARSQDVIENKLANAGFIDDGYCETSKIESIEEQMQSWNR